MKNNFPLRAHFWVLLVLGAGMVYLFVLQGLTPQGAFFTGDLGLKALLSQALAAGNFHFDLQLPGPTWVRTLWDAGLYPYQEPFVYHLAGKYFITFPYIFPLVTAPFYAWFGYRGLYVIPSLAVLATWLAYIWTCRKSGLSASATALGLAFLIFGSSLTLYAALYWEHSLSICLAFSGLALLLPRKGAPTVSAWAAAGAGVLTALAVWFRPEQIFLVLFLGLLSLYGLIKPRWGRWFDRYSAWLPDYPGRAGRYYLAASAVSLLLYGLTNWLVYGSFFGAHAIQVISYQSPLARLQTALENLRIMTVGPAALFSYLPVLLFPLAYVLFAWARPLEIPFNRKWSAWYGFSLAFVIGVALMVPASGGGKQWGPRFLLLLAPLGSWIFACQLDPLWKETARRSASLRWAALGLMLFLGGLGILQNPLNGVRFITGTYTQLQPALAALRSAPGSVIAIADQRIGQVLQPALPPDTVFLSVGTQKQLLQLSQALLAQRQDRFTFVCYSNDCKFFRPDAPEARIEQEGVLWTFQVSNALADERYAIFNVRIAREPH